MSDEKVETPAEAPKAEEAVNEEPKRRTRKTATEETPAEPAAEAPAAPAAEAPAEPVAEKAPKSTKVAAPDYPAMAVTSGGEHDAIRAAQKAMGVAETGVVDADTKAAVKAVQKKSGMKADGNLSAAVWSKIFA